MIGVIRQCRNTPGKFSAILHKLMAGWEGIMEETKGAPDLLDQMVQPGFYVEKFTIRRLNAAA